MPELVDRLDAAAKKKGLTFYRLEQDLGLGGGTIKRWSRQSPRLDKLLAVADALDVSLDYLARGTIRTDSTPTGGPTCDGVPLSMVEADLVAMFRDLKASEKEIAFQFVTMLYQRKTGGVASAFSEAFEDEKSAPA